jgi:arylsulfatase A-like enzyme
MCTPSRQSILTGRYPHATGVTLLRTALSDTTRTVAEHLRRRGYATGAVGKMHFNSDATHGFTYRVGRSAYQQHLEKDPPRPPPDSLATRPEWRPFSDPARTWLNADVRPSSRYEEDSEGTFYARRAIDFLDRQENAPFCLWVSFREPHSPFNFPVDYAGRYDPADMPLPEMGPEDARWMPQEFQDLTNTEKRGIIASYYTSVEYMDRNVGRVLEALNERGLDENTLVIYAGDHGYLLGHHGRFEKHMMWEEAVRSPLLIRAPGAERASTDALTSLVDLAPTLLDVLGEPAMPRMQGQSLVPILTGQTDHLRGAVFSELLPDNKAMVRTERWKYVFTTGTNDLSGGYETGTGPRGIDHRLYDLQTNPEETHNLADDPQYSGVLKSMQIRMLEHFLHTHPHADELPRSLSLTGSLAWFCMPPDAPDDWFGPMH